MTKTVLKTLIALVTIQSATAAVFVNDDRENIEKTPYQSLSSSVLAQISSDKIKDSELEKIIPFMRVKNHYDRPFCEGIRFEKESQASDCSGFYIGDGLLMSAGHCFVEPSETIVEGNNDLCKNKKWVTNYLVSNTGPNGNIHLDNSDVYLCEKIVVALNTRVIDFAIVKIKGDLSKLQALKLNFNEVQRGDRVSVAGYPTGLPLKYAANASVYSNSKSQSYFKSDLDTFAGNSGSPIFDKKLNVVAVLTAGEVDYYLDEARDCVDVNVCNGVNRLCNVFSSQYGASGSMGTKLSSIKAVTDKLNLKIFKN
ncbi:trypsin [Bacteriovorax sp. BSW11_IV]|uniref:S1 family peptidase n=1 Tax=Bacteriovorax sp. BSW11_IV TaxID=1353529 RepID=UPI00038A1E51|nr:serine protease [Bacteriovorax sp. BSW11_IV]EQC46978.1 trypsin [Bacteriovorax sp. BSW11_IV]